MSVDKFGRHSAGNKSKNLRGPKGEGFAFTPDGNYDIKGKKLSNVADASDEKDAINNQILLHEIAKCKHSLFHDQIEPILIEIKNKYDLTTHNLSQLLTRYEETKTDIKNLNQTSADIKINCLDLKRAFDSLENAYKTDKPNMERRINQNSITVNKVKTDLNQFVKNFNKFKTSTNQSLGTLTTSINTIHINKGNTPTPPVEPDPSTSHNQPKESDKPK